MSRPYDKLMKDAECHRYALAEEIYQLGRADKDKELSELPNQYSEKLWKNAHDRGYEQGKADAIAEMLEPYDVESIEELVTNSYNKGRQDVIEEIKQSIIPTMYEFDVMQDTIDFCINILEQLKEQNK